MGLLDSLLQGGQDRDDYQEFVNRYDQGPPTEGFSDNEAVERYQQQVAPELLCCFRLGEAVRKAHANELRTVVDGCYGGAKQHDSQGGVTYRGSVIATVARRSGGLARIRVARLRVS